MQHQPLRLGVQPLSGSVPTQPKLTKLTLPSPPAASGQKRHSRDRSVSAKIGEDSLEQPSESPAFTSGSTFRCLTRRTRLN